MKKYVCDVCGWIYDPEVGDPEGGIAPGTAFEDIPDDWVDYSHYLSLAELMIYKDDVLRLNE